jgi:ribose transport system ATP-binding protein
MSEHDTQAGTLRLEVSGASKTYGRRQVLSDVSLDVAPGEVHALAGHNGSGKSTLVKILSCYHEADAGLEIRIDGVTPARFPMPVAELREAGITVVHQDLGLAEDLTVLENLRVGRYKRRRTGTIDWKAESEVAIEAFRKVGLSIDLNQPVRRLDAADRAAVAIARCLQDIKPGSGLVIFDEATQALPLEMLETFYGLIRRFVADGTSALVVSHRVDDILGFADSVSVLRDGKLVATATRTANLTPTELTGTLLGGTEAPAMVEKLKRGRAKGSGADAPLGLQAEKITGGSLSGFDLEVRKGEIVGLTGLLGDGFTEAPYLLAGARPLSGGTIRVGDAVLDEKSSIQDFLDAGVAFVPGSRANEGLALPLSVRENLTLPRVSQRDRPWLLRNGWQVDEARGAIERFAIRTPSEDSLCSTLSGGNQQKLLLAKWLLQEPDALILLEPTAGVDIGARKDLLDALVEASGEGTAVVYASLDFEDLAEYCDRVVVVSSGRASVSLEAPLTAHDIASAVYRFSAKATPSVGAGEQPKPASQG